VTKQTPFFAAYPQHPENYFKNPRDNATERNHPEADKTVEDLDPVRKAMREIMKAAQTRMAKYFNQKVANKELEFKVGDCVMVNAKNIKTKRPSKKLDYQLRGKFEIEKLCGTNAYRLKLPPLSGKIHRSYTSAFWNLTAKIPSREDARQHPHQWISSSRSM